MNDMYNYLSKNYDEVVKLDNGFYYAKKTWEITKNKKTIKGTEEIYTPAELDSGTSVWAYFPGQGGPGVGTGKDGHDGKYVRVSMESENPPNCVTVIASRSEDPSHIIDMAYDAVESNGSQVQSIVTEGFSLGVKNCLDISENYIESHPEMAESTKVVLVDGNIKGNYKEEDLKALIDNGVEVVYVSGSGNTFQEGVPYAGQNKVDTVVRVLGGLGLNVTGVKCKDTNHGSINDSVNKNDMASFFLGLVDKIGNALGRSDNGNAGFEFYHYNDNTKKIDENPFLDIERLFQNFDKDSISETNSGFRRWS